jgi:hypothetical protein
MLRLRTVVLIAAFLVLTFAPVASAQGSPTDASSTTTTDAAHAPAVVVDTTPAAAEKDAWTFRFLAPTVLAISGIVLVGVAVGYGLRVWGRYRVAR